MANKDIDSDISEVTEALRLSDAAAGLSGRIDCSPETIEKSLAKLVLSLIELLRQLLGATGHPADGRELPNRGTG